jgi:hypothetical protein
MAFRDYLHPEDAKIYCGLKKPSPERFWEDRLQRVSYDGTDESGESYSEKAARRKEKGLHSAGPFIRSHSD